MCTLFYIFVLTIVLYPELTASDVTSANGKYIWVSTVTDWATGESYCNTQYGTSLASIHSASDNTEISSLCSNSAENACYIGLNDQDTENVFVWIDGSNRDYTASTFPLDNHDHGGYDEDCIILSTDGSWGDTPCHTSHPYSFICNAPTQEVHSANDKYIWVGPSITDWFTAESFCNTQYGTSLASIHSASDNTEISSLCANSAESACYMGLNDQSVEASFVWVDGSNRDFTASTFPLDNHDHGGYDEDCMIVYTDGSWGDTPCHTSHPYSFICNAPTQEVHSVNDKYIWVGPSITDWFTAESFCETKYGTTLASVHSAADNTEISNLCVNSAENACYIGLTDQTVESTFVWNDGSNYDYVASLFETGNTDHGGYDEDCVIVFTDGTWHDTPCHTSHPYSFICNAPTPAPTKVPSTNPTQNPSAFPSFDPSESPTRSPTSYPSFDPTANPSVSPTIYPSENPSGNPSSNPTMNPTANPNKSQTYEPTVNPTRYPTGNPSVNPTKNPNKSQTYEPTGSPTINASENPSDNPTKNPNKSEAGEPTGNPFVEPTLSPSLGPIQDQTVASDDDSTTTQQVKDPGFASMLPMATSAWIGLICLLLG
eukprot:466816_1